MTVRREELEVWQRVAGLAQSPSHDFHHIERVQAYADQLAQAYDLDPTLVRLAAILHDLGRGDVTRRHGEASIQASKEIAQDILRFLDLGSDEKDIIINAIETHDQTGLSPPTLEGKILKDADFLAGFGAWGVLRIAMWSGETGRRVDQVLSRITEGMSRRLSDLELPQSYPSAIRQAAFASLFHAELQRPAVLHPYANNGAYIILEGISGSGKNTIADAVAKRLTEKGLSHVVIEEPTRIFRQLRDTLAVPSSGSHDPATLKALFMADRAQLKPQIEEALHNSKIVISVRSYLSTAIYQAQDDSDAYQTILSYDWMPQCDSLILLDLDVKTALSRIQNRARARGVHETKEALAVHRARYLKYASSFPSLGTHIVDAMPSGAEVAQTALDIILSNAKSKASGP